MTQTTAHKLSRRAFVQTTGLIGATPPLADCAACTIGYPSGVEGARQTAAMMLEKFGLPALS